MSVDDPVRWQQAKAVFLDLLDLPLAGRAAALAALSDPELRTQVAQMLGADAGLEGDGVTPGASDPLVAGPGAALGTLEEQADEHLAGQDFGGYRVVRLLGRGGMGVVYLAEREQEGVRRQVALKLVRSTRFTPEHVRRFLAERRLLARLTHPGIVRLLDLGQHDGVPYYAMDLVDGVPILAWCDQHRLDVRARLRLLMQVCDALAHAHHALVLHRDIKPSNVLVDQAGRTHLLDFGIAKALDPDTGETGFDQTGTRQRFFSPHCAAPEMLTGATLTTACDTYALGALLYELLCGAPPLDFGGAPHWAAIEQAILRQEPPRPSERARRADSAAAAARGAVTPAALAAQLRGDLDKIAQRALAKEPDRRYPTVDAFAEDLSRYLEDRPVLARPDAWSYRLGKFVRRHRWPAAFAAIAVLALLAVFVQLWRHSLQIAAERDLARLEQRRAERLSDFLVQTFAMADPTRTLGEQISARQLLDQAVQRLDAAGAPSGATLDDPLLLSMARAYSGLGSFERALALAGRVTAAQEARGEPADTALRHATHIAKAEILVQSGRFSEALPLAELAHRQRAEPVTRALLARVLANLRRGPEAEALYRQNLAQAEAEHWPPARRAEAQLQLAKHLRTWRDYDEARALARQALALQQQALPPQHPDLAETLNTLSSLERQLGHAESALELSRQGLAIQRQVYGDAHPVVGRGYGDLGNALLAADQPQAAAEAMQRSLELAVRFNGADSGVAAMAHYGLGRVYLEALGQPAQAEKSFRAALAASSSGKGGPNQLFFQLGLAAALSAQQRPLEALAVLEPLWPPPPDPREPMPLNRAYLAQELGIALRMAGQHERALALLSEAQQIFRTRQGEQSLVIRALSAQLAAAREKDTRMIAASSKP